MNLKWIIIGVLFCILAVAFSRNPVEERRKAREAAMEGKDPLVESINEHNTKTGKFAPSVLGGLGGKKPAIMEKSVKPAAPSQILPSQTQPSPIKVPVKEAKPPQPESYYPPPPLATGQ